MRTEFTRKVMEAAWERCNGKCQGKDCEFSDIKLATGNIFYDHIIPCALGGTASLDNCQVLCKGCNRSKTFGSDVRNIAKGRRIRAKHIGAFKRSRRGFRGYRRFNGEIVWSK